MSELDRLREQLKALGSEDAPGLDHDRAAELERRLRSAADIPPLEDTLAILSLIAEPASRSIEHEKRSRARVNRALKAISANRVDVARALKRAREEKRVSLDQAASRLKLNRLAVSRIESGQLGMLVNLDPARVSQYVLDLGIDAMDLIGGLFPLPVAGAVIGYTPRTSDQERETAQSQVPAGDIRRDVDWISHFLRASGVPFG